MRTISRLRSELESVRMKKNEQIVHGQEMSTATWELPMIIERSGQELGEERTAFRVLLRTEQEKSKCLLRSIETAARGLGFSSERGRQIRLGCVLEVSE